MAGPPGTDNTSLSRSVQIVLTCSRPSETSEVIRAASVNDLPAGDAAPAPLRRFRAPLHAINHASLTVKWRRPRPRGVSLACGEIRFSGELPWLRTGRMEAPALLLEHPDNCGVQRSPHTLPRSQLRARPGDESPAI